MGSNPSLLPKPRDSDQSVVPYQSLQSVVITTPSAPAAVPTVALAVPASPTVTASAAVKGERKSPPSTSVSSTADSLPSPCTRRSRTVPVPVPVPTLKAALAARAANAHPLTAPTDVWYAWHDAETIARYASGARRTLSRYTKQRVGCTDAAVRAILDELIASGEWRLTQFDAGIIHWSRTNKAIRHAALTAAADAVISAANTQSL